MKSKESKKSTSGRATKAPLSKGRKIELGVTIALAFLLCIMTIGYAVVPYYFSTHGRVNFMVDGKMFIKSVQVVDSPAPALNMTAAPTFTDSTIDLNAVYTRDMGINEGQISFLVGIQNDLPIRRCFYEEPYTITATDINGAELNPLYDVTLRRQDGSIGEFNRCLDSGQSANFIISLTLDSSGINNGNPLSMDVDVHFKINYLDNEPGRVIASISQNDAKLNNEQDVLEYRLRITNTFTRTRDLKLNAGNNHVVQVLGANGSSELRDTPMQIAANSSVSISIKAKLRPGVTPAVPIEAIPISISLDSGELIDCGNMRVHIGGDIVHEDNEAPLINSFVSEIQPYNGAGDDAGDIKLQWSLSDQSPIDTVQLGIVEVVGDRIIASATLTDDQTSYTFHNVPAGRYYISIYAVDAYGNANRNNPSVDQLPATNLRQSCTATWRIPVKYELTNVNKPDVDFIWYNKHLLITLWPDGSWKNPAHTQKWGHFPTDEMVQVYAGDRLLDASEYSYNKKNGQLRIESVSAPIRIVARAEWCWIGWCDV